MVYMFFFGLPLVRFNERFAIQASPFFFFFLRKLELVIANGWQERTIASLILDRYGLSISHYPFLLLCKLRLLLCSVAAEIILEASAIIIFLGKKRWRP